MGRPLAITPDVAARIAAEPPGLSVRALRARLAAQGIQVALATLHRHLRRPAPAAGPAASLRAALAERPAPAEPDPADDLAILARRRDELDRALADWQPQLGLSGAAVRAYRGVMAELRATTATLVELRPRPEVEAERLEALGASARDRLLERAVAAADADKTGQLRQRIADQERAIATLRSVLAEGD